MPPKQFYADDIRKAHNPNLLTITVHGACNRAYQHDEAYFVNTLAPFAQGSCAGDAFLKEVFAKYEAGKKRGLVHKVLEEFEHQPSGIVLPSNLVAKRIEGTRVHRVAWKIIPECDCTHCEQVRQTHAVSARHSSMETPNLALEGSEVRVKSYQTG